MGDSHSKSKDAGECDDESRPPIKKVDIKLPEISRGKLAFVLYNVLTKQVGVKIHLWISMLLV